MVGFFIVKDLEGGITLVLNFFEIVLVMKIGELDLLLVDLVGKGFVRGGLLGIRGFIEGEEVECVFIMFKI